MGTAFAMYNAVWLVDQWDREGKRLIEGLAYCKVFACAEAAYDAAIKAMPHERITLRHGMRVIREHIGEPWSPKTAKAPPPPEGSGG